MKTLLVIDGQGGGFGRALIERLRGELIAKLCTRHRWYAGEIFDLGRPCYLTAEGAFFYYENAFSRSQGVEGGS